MVEAYRDTNSNRSEMAMSMNSVQIGQESYEMPPRDGISIAYFLTVADIERSARYPESHQQLHEFPRYIIEVGQSA